MNNDYVFGLENENKLFKKIRDTFDNTLEKTKKYALFDFQSEKTLVELKSRKNNYNKYPTTMVGLNKIEFAKKQDKEVYFCFNFLDGLYYYKYNPLDNLEVREGGRFDRGRPEIKQYCFIEISKLVKVI